MIDFIRLHRQIISNVNTRQIEAVRKQSTNDKQRIGGYGDEISNAILLSDVRMYKRCLYAYNGRYYEEFDDAIFTNLIIDIMAELNVGRDLKVNSYQKVAGYAKARLIRKDITPVRHMIPFRNYVVDSNELITYPHSAKLDLLYCLDYDYNPDATCPLWEKFLGEVLPEQGLRDVLQEYLGLLFVDRSKYKLEQMLVLLGTGSNGKSVIFETIFGILGRENVSLYDLDQLTRGQSSEQNIADIDGKILNYCSDLTSKDFSGGVFKRLISGESMQARKIYKDPMQLKHIPLFICNANELPDIADKTHGLFRRLLVVPFGVTIADNQQDKQLSVKLRAEYTGILNWIMEGRQRILANNLQFTEVQQINKVKEEYKIVQDAIHGFLVSNHLQATGNKADEYHLSISTLYTHYLEYCTDAGKKPYGKHKFTLRLDSLGFKPHRTSTERCRVVFCDRNPDLNWNVDSGLVYDEPEEEGDGLPF